MELSLEIAILIKERPSSTPPYRSLHPCDYFTMVSCKHILSILVAILLPPLAVCIERGCCTLDLLINILLTLLGYIPGIIHALYIIHNSGP